MKTDEVVKILEDNKITNVVKQEPKIIYTKTFSCEGSEDDYDKHPIVYYTFDNKIDSTDKTNKGYVVCEYCYAKFIYKEKDFYDKAQEEKELLNMGLKDSIRQKEEREKKKDDKSFVNKILKGSG